MRQYVAFLSQDSWDTVVQAAVPNVPAAGEPAAQPPSAVQPPAGPQGQTGTPDAIAAHASVRRFVSERVAECYASVADWTSLHSLASEHR